MPDSSTEMAEAQEPQATGSAQDTETVLWQIEISPDAGQPDRLARNILADAKDLGISASLSLSASRGFLVQGPLDRNQVVQIAETLLVEAVVEKYELGRCGDPQFGVGDAAHPGLFYVLPLAGVTDPEAESAKLAIQQLGYPIEAVRTFCKYRSSVLAPEQESILCNKLLANESIEQVVTGPLQLSEIQLGEPYQLSIQHVDVMGADDSQLEQISRDWQLSLTLVEMQTIQEHFQQLNRNPTDAEIETIAQTWSEHCSHKTLAGRVSYTDEKGTREFDNMLKETIFAATVEIREMLGESDWCVSVFKDNAGIVTFDEQHNVAFKVETHNRPSALEPYGGANTGIGGVIRDTLGTGLGAKPICSTDVFCFASPDTPLEDLPPGVMHPRRIMKGVVAGVRDYGNRMGIPTVNGAVYFDPRYVGNPLVFCGNIGLLPKEKSFKEPLPNDLIVSIGGRTGRDGIHGATFSSAELTDASDITSGGAVQIGNAITEKMLMDVMLQARDRNLYSAVTDCGAGGFSSAVGEMGEEIGAEVWLDQAPLKYDGLSYTEIWISEAQERMVFSIPEAKWPEFRELCESESVEATVIGQFKPTGQLILKYGDQVVADLSMQFMHEGRPPVIRKAIYQPVPVSELSESSERTTVQNREDLLAILSSLNVASKHWVIRQYDHEVQGGSVIKPLVGVENDGPGDASVVRPILNSRRGLAVSCGMNPYYGDYDPYHMAASAIDEAIRNCVAVGADPRQIAILDNFCWGYTDRPETLGTLVRAALACYDVSTVYQSPFISGKDSLNNEFSYTDPTSGGRETISIPSTLLISAMGQVPDIGRCVTMDLKSAGNAIYLLGATENELGGSHWSLVNGLQGGAVPVLDPHAAKQRYERLHDAINQRSVRSCHDLSEGGLAVAIAEMAFAGGLGAELDLSDELKRSGLSAAQCLFSESNSRFIVEVAPEHEASFTELFAGDARRLGVVTEAPDLLICDAGEERLRATLAELKAAWQSPLDWD
ncbi:MAG: phosphoribosylformylglycinamidine synthase subunit PurL [Mariniblastus sp.]|nr:phosphoribosylformylglycinamidine synthase subunit PurL [Mariniblastus sp.]